MFLFASILSEVRISDQIVFLFPLKRSRAYNLRSLHRDWNTGAIQRDRSFVVCSTRLWCREWPWDILEVTWWFGDWKVKGQGHRVNNTTQWHFISHNNRASFIFARWRYWHEQYSVASTSRSSFYLKQWPCINKTYTIAEVSWISTTHSVSAATEETIQSHDYKRIMNRVQTHALSTKHRPHYKKKFQNFSRESPVFLHHPIGTSHGNIRGFMVFHTVTMESPLNIFTTSWGLVVYPWDSTMRLLIFILLVYNIIRHSLLLFIYVTVDLYPFVSSNRRATNCQQFCCRYKKHVDGNMLPWCKRGFIVVLAIGFYLGHFKILL